MTANYVEDIKDFRAFISVLSGIEVEHLKRLDDQLNEATGTPQAPKDWKNPTEWIPRLLKEGVLDQQASDTAKKISDAGPNPRFLRLWDARVAARHGFVSVESGKYVLTELGQRFVQGDQHTIDRYARENGIFKVLEFLYEDTGATKEQLIQKWASWVNTEGGRNVQAKSVLADGVISRIDNVLIPLAYARKEGIPRRYYITDEGVNKIESMRIESAGRQKQQARHSIAVNSVLDVGKKLGYMIQEHPKLRDLMPREQSLTAKGRVFNKELDGLWKTNLPLVGEIRIPIEVQVGGSVTDLLFRLDIVAPHSHYMIIVSDEHQITEIDECITAQGKQKELANKIIYITFSELTEISSNVSFISSKLKPTITRETETLSSHADEVSPE